METIEASIVREGEGETACLVPGWIGNGKHHPGAPSQYAPLFDGALAKFPNLIAIDFTAAGAPSETVAREMAQVFRTAARDGRRLTIVSTSYGAQATVRALEFTYIDLRAVLIDPPAGGESLIKVASLHAEGLAKKIGEFPSWTDRGFPQWAFNKAFCPGLSDSDPIEVPEAVMAKGNESVAEYIAMVRKDAFDGQQGFPLSLCAWQIGEMARAATDLSYLRACRLVNKLYGPSIVRIISTRDNVVVNPAVSDPFYTSLMPNVQRVEAFTNHFDVGQRREFWNELISRYV